MTTTIRNKGREFKSKKERVYRRISERKRKGLRYLKYEKFKDGLPHPSHITTLYPHDTFTTSYTYKLVVSNNVNIL